MTFPSPTSSTGMASGCRPQWTVPQSTKPIHPGEEFEYRFAVPDAGTFWYHSHHNETVQMERGMYGALIVEERQIL